MTDQMKVGRERCVQIPGNHAHNAEILQKSEPEHEKSGKGNDHLTGFLEKSSIMRMSLTISMGIISSYLKTDE